MHLRPGTLLLATATLLAATSLSATETATWDNQSAFALKVSVVEDGRTQGTLTVRLPNGTEKILRATGDWFTWDRLTRLTVTYSSGNRNYAHFRVRLAENSERPRYADFIADNPAVGNATLTLHAQSSDTHVRAASDPAMAAVYSLPTTSPGGITISRQFTQWPRR
jgi:hypothetical protein